MLKRVIISFLALFITVAFVAAPHVYAQNQKDISTLTKDEVVNRDYFAAGDIVELYGTVNGDAYLAGGVVTVDGEVNGDVLAAGGDVVISGTVNQDVRVAGGTVTISGTIAGNVTVGGGTVNLLENAVIGGSLVAGAGNLNIKAPVGRNIKVGAGNIYIDSDISGDVEAAAETLRLTSNAKVSGDLTYWSDQEALVDSEASVSGQTKRHNANIPSEQDINSAKNNLQSGFAQVSQALRVVSIVSFALVGLLIAKLFPKFTKKTTQMLGQKPWASLGYGFLVIFALPIVMIILLITVIGMPLAGILFLLYILALYIAKFYGMVWVGQQVLPRFTKKVTLNTSFLAGLVIWVVLSLIPVVRMFSGMWFTFTGVGALVLVLKATYQSSQEK